MKSFLKERTRFTIYSNILITLLCTSSLFNGYYPVKIDNEEKHANAKEIVDVDLEPLSEEAYQGSGKKSVTMVSKRAEVKSSNKSSKGNKSSSSSSSNYAPAKYSSVTGDAVVSYAKRYIGLKYVYAGRSLKTGTDCSGFTSLIFREFGVKLGVTVQSQLKSGSYIRKSDLQKGDLVFYGYKGRASHVAIYIGNGKVIHESTYKYGVKISPLNMMPYITARRVINAKAIAKVENDIKKEETKKEVTKEAVVGDVVDNNSTNTTNTNTVTENPVVKEETKVVEQQTTDNSNNQVDNSSSNETPVNSTPKEEVKEVVKEETKETSNEKVKEEPKETSIEKVKEEPKETPKDTVKEESSVNTETE